MADRAARGPSRYPGTVKKMLEHRIADLEERVNKNTTNSSKPPSSNPPSVKRPPRLPLGKEVGWWSRHARHTRPPVLPDGLRRIIECSPPADAPVRRRSRRKADPGPAPGI